MYGTYNRLNVSVYASNLEVIRRIRLKINSAYRTNPAHREARKGLYRSMLREHAGARKLYHDVMGGHIG